VSAAPSEYHWIVPLFAGLANLGLCVFVYLRDKQNPVHQAFAFMSLTVVFWNLDIFSLQYASGPDAALYWSRLFRVGMVLMPPTFLHVALLSTQTKSRWLGAVLRANYTVATLLVPANAMNLLVAGVDRTPWGYYPRPLPLYAVHTASFAINALLTFGVLARAYRSSMFPRVRLQARFWLLGLCIAAPLGAANLLAVYGVPVYPLGSLASAAFTAVVGYAIVQHRLMDIDVVITKGTAYALVILLLVVPAFGVTVWMERRTFGRVNVDFSLAILVSYLLVAVLFPVLRSRTEIRVGRSLFREKQRYRAALGEFTSAIVRILDRGTLLHELVSTLFHVLQLDRAAVFTREDGRTFRLHCSLGVPPRVQEFSASDPLPQALAERREAVVREELEGGLGGDRRQSIRQVCSTNGWEIFIPLVISDALNGFVSLGRRRTAEVFTAGDIDLLGTLGAEASIALENIRLNEELRRSQDIIRRADRLSALGTLAAGIAHEVRNPLVSIQTFFQLAPGRIHDREFFSTFLAMTSHEVKRISDLINELLSFARSPARSLGTLDLSPCIERVLTLLEPEARKHKLTLSHSLSPALPPVRADGDQIKQVLINLVLNAIQATEPGGCVSVTSRRVDHPQGAFGQIEVHDTGSGISPEQLEHIFDPFFTTKAKGTGLGLAIAHSEHGGSITVDSHVGHGTTFFVNLPLATPAATTPESNAEGTVDVALSASPPLRRVAS